MDDSRISIVIPTFSGTEYIARCFESILSQTRVQQRINEIVVVIDGPNQKLSNIVHSFTERFESESITFDINQFEVNKGRFDARLYGATKASNDSLLFIDDRTELGPEYLSNISSIQTSIPNIIEVEQHNSISRILYLLRRRIYGEKAFGTDFKNYEISLSNFDSSPKGTAGLLVRRQDFIDGCLEVQNERQNLSLKNISDDTLLLKVLIKKSGPILRRSDVHLIYNSRSKLSSEISHLFERGPKFVDYYFDPKKKYFLVFPFLLVAVIIATSALLAFGCVATYASIGFGIVFLIATAMSIKEKLGDIPKVFIFLPVVFTVFVSGLFKGVILKAIGKL